MKITKTQIARSLRREQTPAEEKLWSILRNRTFKNLKFRRQHPVKDYIVDFFCQELKLVIELDGAYHNNPEQKEKDELRDLHFKVLGYYVLRFENKVVFENRKLIFDEITRVKNERKTLLQKEEVKSKSGCSPLSPGRGARGEGLSILSTKPLTPSQRNLLLAAGTISLIEYDAIKIQFIVFEIPKDIKNAIFTSQNAVKAFLRQQNHLPFPSGEGSGVRAFCVGQKTTSLLNKSGFKVEKTAEYGSELGSYITENHKNEKFYFFCGNKRREEMSGILTEAGVVFVEIMIYKNELSPKKFEQKFDAILFYSPSGVTSFAMKNDFGESLAVCIGKTTAAEAKKYTEHINIANATTVESVIAKAVMALRNS